MVYEIFLGSKLQMSSAKHKEILWFCGLLERYIFYWMIFLNYLNLWAFGNQMGERKFDI